MLNGLGLSVSKGLLVLTVLLLSAEALLATQLLCVSEEANWASLGLLVEAVVDEAQVHALQETVFVDVSSLTSLSPVVILYGRGTVVVGGFVGLFWSTGCTSLGESGVDQSGLSCVGGSLSISSRCAGDSFIDSGDDIFNTDSCNNGVVFDFDGRGDSDQSGHSSECAHVCN